MLATNTKNKKIVFGLFFFFLNQLPSICCTKSNTSRERIFVMINEIPTCHFYIRCRNNKTTVKSLKQDVSEWYKTTWCSVHWKDINVKINGKRRLNDYKIKDVLGLYSLEFNFQKKLQCHRIRVKVTHLVV